VNPAIWRVLFAVFVVVIIYLLLPPVSRILGFGLGGDVLQVVKICIAALAVYYVVWGKGPFA